MTFSARKHADLTAYSTSYVGYVVTLMAVLNAVSYIDRMALALLAPLIKADLALSDTQLGLLIGLAFALFYAVCGIPIARWADRGIRRNIIAMSLTIWSAMTALSGAAQNFWHLFVARAGIGAGEAGCFPAGASLVCDYVPLKRRPGAFAILNFGVYAGMMFGLLLAGTLGERIGWRWTFVALGLPGLALAVIVRLTLREPERGRNDPVKQLATQDGASLSLRQTIAVLWKCRTYRLLVLFMALNGFVLYGLGQWWPSFFARMFGLSLSSLGVYLGVATGVGSGTGVLLGGLLANKAAQRDVRLPLFIGTATTALTVPAALGTLFFPTVTGALILVGLTAFAWSVAIAPVQSTIYSVTATQMRATAGSLSIFMTSVLGFGFGPVCVGALSDMLTPSLHVEALRYALLAPVCILPLMVIVLRAAALALPGDLSAATQAAQSENA